ncbi:MAG: terpene cyclase/mutase family protein [Planctomycetaceae bacterium]|nr:terpene cyclase/mutase family protein [Planctomycetaceae bacterium]
MTEQPYLLQLGTRLAAGLAGMEPERRERHRQFVLSQQMPDGGFRGREGDSDLYYTAFAVRCLMMLGGLRPDEASKLFDWLNQQKYQRLSVVDLVSWLYAGLMVQISGGGDLFAGAEPTWPDEIAATLETTRTADGGYARTTEGAAGSTYHSFMVVLACELIGRKIPQPNRLIQFLYDRQRDDGGFVEIAPMRRSGTNPTAAAVALLRMLGGLDDDLPGDVRAFLKEVRSADGGFSANTRIPFPDGLSSFTALLTCQDLNLSGLINPRQLLQFVTHPEEGLEFPTGGFRGAAWDNTADVEYTFYGLGLLALLDAEQTG